MDNERIVAASPPSFFKPELATRSRASRFSGGRERALLYSQLSALNTQLSYHNTVASIELWPSLVIFSYVKNAIEEEYANKANDSRRKAQTDCQVNTQSNNGRGNKSPETPLLPAEKGYGTRQIE
jgi:hypothetical protein